MKTLIACLSGAVALAIVGCGPPPNPPKIVDNLPPPLVGGPERPLVAAPPVVLLPEPPKPVQRSPATERNWMPAAGISGRWRHVIIHHSGDERSTPTSMAAYHMQKGWDELGYHFVIGNGVVFADGKVHVGTRWRKQKHGAHTRVKATDDNRWNEHGIGICLIGNFDHHPPSARQMESLTELVAFLCERGHVATKQILTHGSVDPHTRCPGHNFSLGALRKRVAAAMRNDAIHASAN